MKIIQYNCQSFRANKSNIEFYLNKFNVDICILSEIFNFDQLDDTYKLFHYNLIAKTRDDHYGGVAIGFKKAIKFKKI